MTIEEEIEDLNHDLDLARKVLERISESTSDVDPETGYEYRNMVEHQYRLLSELLRNVSLPENWSSGGKAKSDPSRYALFLSSQLVGEIVNGRIPESINDLFHGIGRPGLKALQMRAIESAIRYLAAVDADIIQATRATEKIAAAYGVRSRTVQRWAAKWKSDRQRQATRFREVRSRGTADVDHLSSLFTKHMLENGRRYRESRHHPNKKGRR